MQNAHFSLPSLIEVERKHLLSQRKKAMSLIFLMIMLAQTSYIGALEGWSLYTELEEDQEEPWRVSSPAVCAATSRSSGTAIHVDVTEGNDAYPGTANCPKASLGAAVTLATSESASNPEIVLHAGLYHENVSVNNLDNLLIRAADGDRVVFDGTRSITDNLGGVWGSADSDGIQEVTLTEDGWQLFLAYEEQVPARWPNAGFDDETVFNRSYWAEGTLTGSNNAYTKGWLTDAGPEAGVHTGLNETVNASGLDPVGAIAVMNLGSFRSNSRIITDWNPNNGTFAYDGDGVGWKTKHHAYFLEGKRELIDVDGEWWYNNTNNRLHYKTPSGQDANNLDLRVKVQPFAISVDGSDGVTIQGIDFFGTTVNFNNCDGCSFTNSTLEYPSTSKRGLGIAGESEDDRWMTRFYRSTNSFVDKISITNTDGGAIEFQGSPGQSNNNTVNNSYFHAIDWSAADQKGLMVTIYEGGRDMYFTNNSVHLTGASSVLSIGDAPKVFYNEVWDVGHLQTDGAVVQVMQGEAPGSIIAYNWIHDIIKYGARFDAPIGQAGEGRNGTMHHNVIWNAAGGLMVKGDYHDIHNNTVFNSSGKNDMIILTDNGVNNGNSTIHQNAADKMADHRSDSWSLYPLPAGTYWNNWNGYVNTTDSVWNQLVDPANRDFRPKANSHLSNMSAGAYDAGVSNPWTAGISWTYSPMSDPISGCMDSVALNYNSNAIFSDGSCTYTTLSSSTTSLSLFMGRPMSHALDYSTVFLADDKQTAATSGDIGKGSNIALDSNGAVHICHQTSSNQLQYTTNASGNWQSAIIDTISSAHCFIILDSVDDIHITYHDKSNDNMMYATKALLDGISSSNWDIVTMDNNGDTGDYGSMAVDADDRLHVAYYSAYCYCLKYATKDNGSSTWSREVVENTANDIGKFTSIALDSNGKPHIIYRDNTNKTLRYTHEMGSSWVITTIDSDPNTGGGTSLAIDSNDHLHVAYKTNTTEMAYTTNRSGSWVKTTLDGNTSGGWGVNFVDIMLDEGDDPHVVYSDIVGKKILYMSNTRGVWERILVAGDSISWLSSATMDQNGGIRVSYYIEGSDKDLGYAAVRSLAHVPTFEIEPDLPTGLSLDADTGTISGTPSQLLTSTEFTIWANTTRTSAMTTLSIDVDWAVNLNLIPTAEGRTLTINQAMFAIGFNRPMPSFAASDIATSATGANDLHAADIDGDGDLDIVSASYTDNTIAWYENDGNSDPTWTVYDIVTNASGARTIYVADMDGDGDLDIVSASKGDDKIAWYENNGDGILWTTAVIATSAQDAIGVHVADMDGDGDLDIISASEGDNTIAWYENDGNSDPTWTASDITTSAQGAHGVSVGDMDCDGDLDIVSASYSDNTIAWYENDGNSNPTWAASDIVTDATGARNVFVADMDGDCYLEIFSASDGDDTIAWYENNGATNPSWTARDINTSADGAYDVFAADVDGDGDLDVVSASEVDGAITWYENNGATNPSWTAVTIATNASGARGVYVADVDGDGDLDIVSASFGDDTIAWYETDWTTSPNASVTGASCGSSPDLPAGLSMASGTCSITGTPTELSTNTTYTIYANYTASGLQLTTTLYFTVNDVAPSLLAYSPENMTLTKDTAMTPNLPSVSGGTVTSWEINPSLPTGLTWGTTDGKISGTPTVLQTTATTYTVWANNSGGSTSAQVNITINDEAPDSLSYSPENMNLTKGTTMAPNLPSVSGGAITSWEISPSLPSGLTWGTADGKISGTPTVLQTTTAAYTVWANNSGGSISVQVNITINDQVPNALGYTPENMTLEKGTTMTTNTPSVSGGAVTSWEIDPSLPSGLSFGSTNGSIWGTPTILQTIAVAYTIWANNSGGSESAQVNITINDQIASISYSSPVDISNNRLLTTITPTISGGAVTSWEISPSLPTGLSFGITNGSIWGTPENVTSNATYTIWANNSGGSASATLTLNMNWTLTPSADGAYITRNSSIGTDITWEWDYDPLEAGNLTMYASWRNTCAIENNGDLYCWGRNGNGQIGNGQIGSNKWKDVPTQTNSLGNDAISVTIGEQHTCALLDNGVVKCWGRNNNGQVGVAGGDQKNPQTVSLGSGRTATSVYAGYHHTCAILDDQSVKCWGGNSEGELGIGSTTNQNSPTTINSLGSGRHAISLALGQGFTCALLDDGSIKCWGSDDDGRRGDGGGSGGLETKSPPSTTISLPAGRTATQISAGEAHACALLDDGSVVCWGRNIEGELGDGTTTQRNSPTATSSFGTGHKAVFVSVGYSHTCALLDDGGVRCWGSNNNGQLGDGTSIDKSSPQSTDINLGTGVTATGISAGGGHTCAMLNTGGMKCWGARGGGQLGDNSNFASGDQNTPVNVHGSITWMAGEFMPSPDVEHATCGISPALPTGMSLTSGTCAITGTPTVTALNATYTIWANVSGQSFSGQIWLEVGLNAPDISYSSSTYTYTKDSVISPVIPTNTGGEISTWELEGGPLPAGLNFGTSNGTFWGTPTTIVSASTYTVWANNSAGSDSFSITFTVNDVAPSITFTPSTLNLVTGTAMTSVTATNSGGSIVSCSVSPSLPSGLSLSNTCTLSGTPTVASSSASYTITATNTGGSDTATFSLTVQASGGSLTITPTNREGSVNSALANITMSYTHTASNYGWTSGVSNTTTALLNNYLSPGGSTHWLASDSGERGEMAIVYARNDSGASTYSLGLLYRWGGTWTETIIDNGTNTGYHPSVAIDRDGALHIAYIDDANDKLRYATNASGTWVLTTLGSSTFDNDGGRGTAIAVHPITDAVHIVTTINDNTYRDLQYHTNENGSWVNETITNTSKDEGHDPVMAMDSNGNLHVAYYCDDGCSDLRLSSRINGVWQNETVASTLNIGNSPDIVIDSQDTIHIVSQYLNNKRIYLHSGTPGSWTEQTGLSGGNAHWPTVDVDSNDAVHISYHYGSTAKDVMYMTNASGSWSSATMISGYGGWGSDMTIDVNDDIFIPNIASGTSKLQLTKVQGSGQGLTALPIYDVSPMLPDGLVMNWRNGTISGTPTQALANTSFTVTVTALSATTTGTFTLFITGEPGIITYTDIQATNRTIITTATPTFTNNSTSGTATTWAISPSLPNGLSFGTTNGSIWGTPTLEQIKTSYTIWANNTAGSSSTTLNITIGPMAPGPFEYNPEDNIWTNNTEVHLAPQFINQITGNGSTWQVADIRTATNAGSLPGLHMKPLRIGDTLYFSATDGSTGQELWAYNLTNQSTWQVADIRSGSADSNPGYYSSIVVDDTLYFSANDGSTGHELWAHNTSNGTTWQVANIRPGSSQSNPGSNMMHVVNGVLYFNAHDGNAGVELWKHDPSTDTTSRLNDINPGGLGSSTGKYLNTVVGDVLYFSAQDGSTSHELWAYNTSNSSDPWRVMDINSGSGSSNPGEYMQLLVGDTIYFSATDGSTGVELWAHDTSNHSTWQAADLNSGSGSSGLGQYMELLVGDTIYFSAVDGSTGSELWAYDTSNNSAWQVADLNSGSSGSKPGQHMEILIGDTIYFSAVAGSTGSELWAYNTSNHSTWQVADLNSGSGSNPGLHMELLVGDTIYFSATDGSTGVELWAHDTSNHSTWQAADLNSGSSGSNPGQYMQILIGDTLYFSAHDGSTGSELWAYRPSIIDYNTNTGGAVTSWAINASLPSGVSFGTNNGTIYGTPTELWTQKSYMVWANNSGGSTVAYLNITVVDEVPTLSYSPENLTLTKGQSSSDLPLNATLTGPGTITSWEINATLPSGLNFGTSNGTIWGIPTVLQTTATTYTIWANNSGGSTSATVNITIIDVAPGTFEYNPENNTFTNNTEDSIAPTVTNSAGVITSWEINASLPSGLTIGVTNGTIYGTPTELWTQTSYMVWANNSGGSSVGYLNITVVDEVPTLSYSPNPLTLRNNTVSSDLPLVPILTGSGEILSWAINASLPSGVSFGTNNGTIYGTPTELWNQTTYMVWGNNTGGSAVVYLNITVVDQVPTLAYSPSTLVLTKGNQSSDLPLNATLTGPGVITSLEISPTLPTGLNFGTDNGTIWGIATVLQTTATTYTIWANNSGGSSSATVTITINDVAPGTFEYNPENNTFTNNTYVQIEPDFINLTTGNGSSWSAPAGTFMPWASFCLHHVYNGTLYTAATNGTGTSPTFYGYGLDNETAWVINSTLSSPGCKTVSYGMAGSGWEKSFSMAHGTSLYFESSQTGWGAGLFGYGLENGTLWRQSSSGFEITSGFTLAFDDILYFGAYHNPSVGQALHAHNFSNGTTWLVIDASSGNTIPTSIGSSGGSIGTVGDVFLYQTYVNNNYALWAYNTSNGSAWAISSNAISSGGPVLDGVLYYSRGTHSSHRSLYAYNVSNETSWQVHSRSGVNSIRELGGVLYYDAASTTHSDDSLWAHNPDNGTTWEIGGSNAEIRGSFLVAGGTLFYRIYTGSSAKELWAYDPSNTTAWQATNVGLNDDTFTSLGNTVYFTSETTPASGEHDLWAYNTANETTWYVANISASNWGFGNNPYPNSNPTSTSLIFAGDTIYIREGGGMRSHQPASINYQTNTGGTVTTWAINASLPSGLTFSTTNGSIYGTPTELWTQTSYMVWANNSGGSSVAYLNITVIDQVPSLSYSPSALVLTINAQSTELPLNATLTGPGAIVSWEINASLPNGLSFGTTNGTIWGIPTVMQTTAVTYTIWGNNTGGSTSATVTITINDAVPGPFEYDPENNTWANDSLIHLAPDFINYVSGNGSTWLVTDITSGIGGLGPGAYFEVLIGDTIYFDADDGTDGSELWAHDTSNHSTWQVADIYSGSGDSSPGSGLYIVVDGVLYFSADDGVKGSELWAHNPANSSTWRVADINSNSAFGSSPTVVDGKPSLVGDTFYFSATDGNTGRELWAHDTSNHSTWRVTDINSGSGNTNPGTLMQLLVGDTIYFNADDGSSGIELWAHDTSNISTWQVADILNSQGNSEPGKYMSILIEDTIYFDANDGNSGVELWAHSISNTTTWQTADIYGGGTSSYAGEYMSLLVGDTLYFSAGNGSTGQELWAHDASNHSTWLVADIHSSGDSDPGQFLAHLVGDTLYFSADDGNIGEELWAHDTSNHSTWLVSDILGYDPISFVNSGSRPGQHFSMVIDDIIYFSACNGCSTGNELYAYNTSNYTTWLDQEIAAGSASSTPGNGLNILVGDTLYLNAYTVATGRELFAYQPSSINIQTNTGGTVLSWAINGTLPSGLSFGTNNGTIYGRVTELWTQTSYMVWANNTGGSTVGYLNITVNDLLPNLSYSPNDLVLTRGLQSSDLPLNATLIGVGEITSWEINGTLPAGLNFGTNNGTIWGIPTVLQTSSVTYTIWANNSGGSSSATVNITILEEIASISYNPSAVTIVRGYDMANISVIKTGGNVVSWEISPSLPSGLSFDNGTVYGLPLVNMSATTYTVYANNSGGSASTSLTLTINEPTPNIDYNPDNYTMSNGSSYTITPVLLDEMNNPSGTVIGMPSSWSISQTLPSGLNFGTNNGTIWGTPTVLINPTQYNITATNVNGSSTTSINITINDVVPMLSYSPENLTLIKGLESIDLPLNATLTGSGVITSWEINGSLPTGLNFGTNNGTIWGIPTVLQTTAMTYTIWANNSGGSTSATINITINDQVPLVSYSPENLTLLNNTVSSNLPLSPTLTGPGVITSWAIHPDLPTGLTFETSNGTIWGAATQRFTTTQYTVWANNSGGSSVANLNITVLHEVPMFTYSSYNLTLVNNTAMSVMEATSTGGEITSWQVGPIMPTGLTFNVANGTLSGTPTVVQNMIMYTVWGNNTGGSHAVYFNITIYDPIVTLDYNPENQTLTRGEAMTDMTPILSGIVDDWAIEPSLPSGLSFVDGVISGTPTVNMTQTMYTIWANNTGGAASHTINLTINEQIAVLDYNPENLTLTRSIAMTTLDPTVTGGNVETWEIQPSVPAGLAFANGVLSGTPIVNMTQTMYTIWANNTGGSASHTINLTINEPIVVLDYNPENVTMIRSTAMTALYPTVTGGSVETWAIHPSIPAGLNFANGVLSGTPSVNMTRATFTIYANNTGGSASHTINLTILEPGVILDYNPENMTLTRGVAMVTMTPSVTNGTAETWSIDPLLPSGLSFNNGVISGTPMVNMTRMSFTVWANNSGGVAFHTINLTILEPIVGLDYNPENLTLTRDVAMTPLHPIVTGGNVSVWGIEPVPLSGLTFANGLLSGTPTVNQTTPIMYTIYANTTGGTITHTINITVLEPVVNLFYNPENQTLTRSEQIIAWLPTISGGIPETWAIEPALPSGLVFENGTISGTPTVNSTTTQYMVWANNSGGPASTSINITINEPVPEIEYVPSDLILTRGTTMATLQPNVTGGAIASWHIEPSIPNGLVFLDGVISGTPTAIQNQTQYVVWANNSGGSLMTYLNITILDIIPEISYAPENMTLTNDTSVVDWLPVNVGGPILAWSISPQLSQGLEFNETTGHITGTPTAVTSLRTYLVTATNSGGSATTQINITVLDQVPMVAYVPDDVLLLNNSTVLTMEAILTGGAVTSWSIVPDLSPGLFFDTTNGTLSGVATHVQGRTMYAITASNDVGSITVFANITVEDLFYNMTLGPLYLLNNSEMIALEPELIISGSAFEIGPELPEGLFFGAENGTVWGTPTELMDLTNFTIYANSSLFNDEFVVQIGVLEDTDRDGLPNELPGNADPRRGLIEDLDDDDDGFTDLVEGDCLSDSLDDSDVPADFDGDLICDPIDDDVDGDGLNNTVETNTSTYVDANNTGTDPWDADTDGDGICDGPTAPALPVDYCEAGPDAFPNDVAAYLDTDGDGMPDELWGESTTGLIEDLDDDSDNWTDLQEADCGMTDPKDEFDTPLDSDGDGICDFNDVLSVIYGTGDFELLQGQRNVSLQPIVTGMAVDIWEITPALPYGLFFGGDTMARTSSGNGTIYGVPLVPSNMTEYTVTATNLLIGTQISTTFNLSIWEDYDLDGLPNNNTRLGLLEVDLDDDGDGFNDSFELECGGDPYNRSSVPKIESDGTCYNYRAYEEAPEKDKNPFKPICFPIIFLVLAFILVVPMILTRRQARVGVRAEHVSGTPAIQSGSGTQSDPFVLKAVIIPYNSKGNTVERIRCAEMSPGYEVNVREINVEINKKRFGAVQFGGIQDGTGVLKSNSDGLLMIQFTFDGTLEPSQYGMVYKSELILDEKTYFVWHVETKAKK